MTKTYYFYVLYCKDQTLYAGYTTNLNKRLAVHNAGKGAKYTQLPSRRPVTMIYAEEWASKSLAMSAEAKFKQLRRSDKLKYLALNGQLDLKATSCVLVDKRQICSTDHLFENLKGE